jgi:RNA ligase (TIGR02306 family)
MTEFHVNIVRIGEIVKHPNADLLSITHVHGGYPCIIRTGDFQEGDLAVYIPIDTVLPDTEPFAFLGNSDRKRLKAKKLRGIFSMGLLIEPPKGTKEDDDVAELMGIERYEPPLQMSTYGECEPAPKGWAFVHYTSIEGLRRYQNMLVPGEEVVVTEKLHGACGRYVHDGERLWVGSRTQVKRESDLILWWQVAHDLELEQRLAAHPMKIFFGEVFGQVGDLKYGHHRRQRASFRVFDVFDVNRGMYLNHAEAHNIAMQCGLDWVPFLYVGPWNENVRELCEGTSFLADHTREGFVVKPTNERFDDRIGRVILKMHGQGYLLRRKK